MALRSTAKIPNLLPEITRQEMKKPLLNFALPFLTMVPFAADAAILNDPSNLSEQQTTQLRKLELARETHLKAVQQLKDIQGKAFRPKQEFLITFRCPAETKISSKCQALKVESLDPVGMDLDK
jgi:hypothetical protein